MGSLVLSSQFAVRSAYQAFDVQGQLTDEGMASRVVSFAEKLVSTAQKLA
ncbi:MAG: hypothetical protein HRU25_12425 [Psychrobium sp.]|nr:hypothetical protein [Psychrobium sp.]